MLRALDLVSLLGAPAEGVETELPVLPSDFAALAGLAAQLDLHTLTSGRYLAIHTGAKSPTRRWPPARYAQVADQLLQEFDVGGVLVTAGEPQQREAAELIARSRMPER